MKKYRAAVIPAALLLSLCLASCGSSAEQVLQEGSSSLTEKFYEYSIDAMKASLEKDPDNEAIQSSLSGAYLALAKSLADAGKTEEAVEVLKEGISLLPGEETLQDLLAELQNRS